MMYCDKSESSTESPEQDDEILILLALLSVDEVREQAGLPPVGTPLAYEQIADWCGCSPSTIRELEMTARRKMIGAMRRAGTYEELKNRNHGQI